MLAIGLSVKLLLGDELPEHHRDPFDRILIAQALEDGLVLVSGDLQLRQYRTRVVW